MATMAWRTITKCDDAPIPKSGKKEIRKMPEKNTLTNISSAMSLHSAVFSEGDEEYEETGDLGENFQSPQLDSNSTSAKNLAKSVTTGVTKQGNKTLEWFTVLAEYQHRKQLTWLHNVISCIVCDYDAIISDRTQAQNTTNTIGTTAFGI